MGSSFSAAPLVFLAAPARTGIVAPNLLLLLWLSNRRLDVGKLSQKVKAHFLAGQLHCADLLAEVLNVHLAGLEGFSDVRPQRERLEAIVCRLWQNEVTTHHSERRQQTMSEKIVQLNEEIIKGSSKN